jgi:hypothetical protein
VKIKTSFKRLLLAGLSLSLLSVGLAAGSVFADTGPETVPSGAQVTTSSEPPNIECKWELPDMDSSVGGIQYQSSPGLHDHDADMTTDLGGDLPSVTPACDLADDGAGLPTQPDGVRHMVTVLPNSADQPEEERVQLWAAVDHPNGIDAIDDVYWKIYHPDGSFKIQVHANPDYNGGVVRAQNGDNSACSGEGTSSTDDTMFHAAWATGQLSQRSIEDTNNGLIALCQQEVKAFYYSEFSVSKEQPCGEYKVEVHAVSNGAESVMTNYIDVVCFWDLKIDFDNVDWGAIAPGTDKTVAGDLNFGTSTRPTVLNVGNAGMWVGVQFSPLVQQGVDGPKTIDDFDAAFGRSPSTLLHFDPIAAGELAWFDDDPSTTPGTGVGDGAQLLCSDQIGKLDLSVHPPSTLPAGVYTGQVTVMAKDATIPPTAWNAGDGNEWWNECVARFHAGDHDYP